MHRTIRIVLFALLPVLCSVAGLPVWADQCGDAKNIADQYLGHYEDIREMLPKEQKKFVEAACQADDEERAQIMKEVGARVEEQISDKATELTHMRDDAKQSLKAAIDADECKDQKDELKTLLDRVGDISDRIEKMSNGVSAGSNPVFSALRELGQQAHSAYQSMNSSFQNAASKYGNAEVSLSDISRRVDFMDPRGCQVVELKPDSNSSAQSDGFDDAKKARDWLNDPDNFKKFVDQYPAYKDCKKFVARVDCYHYCPGVAEDGSLQLGSIDWKTGCKGPE